MNLIHLIEKYIFFNTHNSFFKKNLDKIHYDSNYLSLLQYFHIFSLFFFQFQTIHMKIKFRNMMKDYREKQNNFKDNIIKLFN